MNSFLPIELEKRGMSLFREQNFEEAIMVFDELARKFPNYEYGVAFFHLACCFEEIMELEKAKENYLVAIKYFPDELHRLGAYASFQSLYGSPSEAFRVYSDLLVKYKSYRNSSEDEIESIVSVLERLSKQIY